MCNGQDESIRMPLTDAGQQDDYSFNSFSKDSHIDLIVMKADDLKVIHPPEVSVEDFEAIKPQGYRIKNDYFIPFTPIIPGHYRASHGMQDLDGIVCPANDHIGSGQFM